MNKGILNALCEYHHRCPECYRYRKGSICDGCDSDYFECKCKPLTAFQILENET